MEDRLFGRWISHKSREAISIPLLPYPSGDRRLVITADDFGADVVVNEAVEIAHHRGALTAASLMVGAPAAGDAVARARTMPKLGVGLHLVLVEGRPTLPAREVPDLVDEAGRFRVDMVRAGAAMFFVPRVRRQLAREIEAQFAAFAATGLPLDHVNAHKHFHLHPTIAGLILNVGSRYGLRAVRMPIEPVATLAAVEPGRYGRDWVTEPWARLARQRFRAAGIIVPDQVFGLRWSGAMTAPRLRGLVDALPAGFSEIYLHPATANIYPGSAKGYLYVKELAALTDADVVAAARKPQIRLSSFAALS